MVLLLALHSEPDESDKREDPFLLKLASGSPTFLLLISII